jgi:ribosome-associated toxin RatA of RatAB toxin-antitoxin module
MIESVATTVINKSPAEVFQFVAHVENNPQWIRGAHVVDLSEGSFGDGALFQQDHVVVRVSHVQVNQGFETESIRIHFPARFVFKHTQGMVQFEQVGQGTRLTLKEQFELTLFMKPFEQLLAKKAQQESQAALEQLKKLLEQKTG